MDFSDKMASAFLGSHDTFSSSLESVDFRELIRDRYLADWKHEKIMEQIQNFESKLDNEHEIGIFLTSFGAPKLMAVRNIGYQNPDMLYFYGTVDGESAQLIQHISQLNFLLVSVKKPDPNRDAYRIVTGFHD